MFVLLLLFLETSIIWELSEMNNMAFVRVKHTDVNVGQQQQPK